MAIVSNTVGYLDGDVLLEAFFAFDDSFSGRRPAVLINHTWAGRDDFVAEKAKKLAALGYVGFAVDMYGKGVLGSSPEENAKLMQPFMDDRANAAKAHEGGALCSETYCPGLMTVKLLRSVFVLAVCVRLI